MFIGRISHESTLFQGFGIGVSDDVFELDNIG
jgi:hypothetical protein